MISTLRNELTQRCDEIIELEAALSSLNQQVTITTISSLSSFKGHVRGIIYVNSFAKESKLPKLNTVLVLICRNVCHFLSSVSPK